MFHTHGLVHTISHLKQLVTNAQVLSFYELEEALVIQYDVSSEGIGAALQQ